MDRITAKYKTDSEANRLELVQWNCELHHDVKDFLEATQQSSATLGRQHARRVMFSAEQVFDRIEEHHRLAHRYLSGSDSSNQSPSFEPPMSFPPHSDWHYLAIKEEDNEVATSLDITKCTLPSARIRQVATVASVDELQTSLDDVLSDNLPLPLDPRRYLLEYSSQLADKSLPFTNVQTDTLLVPEFILSLRHQRSQPHTTDDARSRKPLSMIEYKTGTDLKDERDELELGDV